MQTLNSNLTLGLGLNGGNDVKRVDLYCKRHKPNNSSYIAENGIRGLQRRLSRKGRVFHERQPTLKIDFKQNKLETS